MTLAACKVTNDADTVAWNSGLAAGILQVLYERGLNVPLRTSPSLATMTSITQFLSPCSGIRSPSPIWQSAIPSWHMLKEGRGSRYEVVRRPESDQCRLR